MAFNTETLVEVTTTAVPITLLVLQVSRLPTEPHVAETTTSTILVATLPALPIICGDALESRR
jgi:hypothetical protein